MAASMKCSSRPSPPRETARIRPEGPAPAAGARSDRPSLSVIVEWENARLAEARRSLLMLEALARQLEEDAAEAATARPVEILILHNPAAVDGRAIEAMLARVRPPGGWPATLRLLASGERGYYEQKNFGAAGSTGEIVLFLDSDVVPEPGWLGRLLAALEEDPERGVVCGSTHVEPEGFYARAMALFWLFPLRRPEHEDGLEEVQSFYANNVAFRRAVIAGNPFPEGLPLFRGQCVLLARSLRDRGVPILRHAGARVAHPPPDGLAHFVNRAMSDGHDEAVRDRLRGRRWPKRAYKSVRDFGRQMRRVTRRIARDHRAAGLSPASAVGAWGLALAYYGCRLAGQLLSTADPGIVRRYFPIS
jgi:hypothetical protein